MVHSYPTITRDIVCKECGKKYGEEEVKLSFVTQPVRIYWRCPECKEIFRKRKHQILREKMLRENNPC